MTKWGAFLFAGIMGCAPGGETAREAAEGAHDGDGDAPGEDTGDGNADECTRSSIKLACSTLLGGEAREVEGNVYADLAPDGDVIVVGQTSSRDLVDFPADDFRTGFAAKVSADCEDLHWIQAIDTLTFQVTAIDVDGEGAIHLAGSAVSANDGWTMKLSADATTVLHEVQLGGPSHDGFNDVVVDDAGNIYLAGQSYEFPTTSGAYKTQPEGLDALVVKLDPEGNVLWATFLGGTNGEGADLIDLAPDGSVVVVGDTRSTDFPVTAGAGDPDFTGVTSEGAWAEVFVARLSAAGDDLEMATYVGGQSIDTAVGLDVTAAGDIVIGGVTTSTEFPTTAGAYDRTFDTSGGIVFGPDDDFFHREAFVTSIAPDGGFNFSTLIGSDQDELVLGVVVGADGMVYLSGATTSAGFPTTADAYDATFNGYLTTDGDQPTWVSDGFFAALSADGSSLDYGTFFGGRGEDGLRMVGLGGDAVILYANPNHDGEPTYPTTKDAHDRTPGGEVDYALTAFGLPCD